MTDKKYEMRKNLVLNKLSLEQIKLLRIIIAK